MITLKDIWTRRFGELNTTTASKEQPHTGFDLNQPLNGVSMYSTDNYNDRSIHDLRNILTKLFRGKKHNTLNNQQFKLIKANDFWKNHELICNSREYPIKIISGKIMDNAQFTITIPYLGIFSIVYSNNFAKIKSFINVESGQPINLYELTNILVHLNLDEDHHQDWFTLDTFTINTK